MTISVRITEEEKQIINQYAKDNDLSMSQVIRKALKEFFKEQKK